MENNLIRTVMKNRLIAALLAFFLGGLGVHKFYLNRSGQGILYLLFCWTFIPSIIAFIEFFILIFMDERTFDMKYNPDVNFIDKSMVNISDELEKLYNLKERGVITNEEFEERKRKLL